MGKLKTALLKIVGGENKVKLFRDIILLTFALLFAIAFPLLRDLSDPNTQTAMMQTMKDNPILIIVVILPFFMLSGLGFMIFRIDAWEDKKAEKRHQELLKAIRGNENEHRNNDH